MTDARPVRARILESAVRLFAERGFDATTVQAVVTDAGVTKGALYHHFVSKDALLYEIYATLIGTQNADLNAVAGLDLSAEETLRRILCDAVCSTAARLDEAAVFFRESHKLDAAHMSAFRADRRRYHEGVRAVVQRGLDTGEFASTVPADTVVHVAMGVVNQLPVWFDRDGSKTPDELGEEIAEFVVAGLLAGPVTR